MQKNSLAIIPVGIAINIVVGLIVNTLKLPIYLDAIGTIIVSILLGWRQGAITGVLSFVIGGLLFNPVLPFFSLTQVAISIYIVVVGRMGAFKNWALILLSGIGLGIIAGIISAPVITYLFGGVTGSGRSLLTGYLISVGNNIWNSVIISGLTSEPIDKAIQLIIACWVIKTLPSRVMDNFKDNKVLIKNFLQ